MICEKCGTDRLFWRCDNHETKTSKYKCLNCNHIMIIPTEQTKQLFTDNELSKLKEYKEDLVKSVRQENAKKGAEALWKLVNVKNYGKNFYGTYTVQKTINGKFHYGGTYKTEEIAKKVVEKLNECDWDLEQLPRIKKEVVK